MEGSCARTSPDSLQGTIPEFASTHRFGLRTKSRTFEKISNGGALPNGGGSQQRPCGMCVPSVFGTELGSRECRFASSEFFDPTAGDVCNVVARECGSSNSSRAQSSQGDKQGFVGTAHLPNALVSMPLAAPQWVKTDCNCRYEGSPCLVNAF